MIQSLSHTSATLFGATLDTIARQELSLGDDYHVTTVGQRELDTVDPDLLLGALPASGDWDEVERGPLDEQALAELVERIRVRVHLPDGLFYVRAVGTGGDPVWGIVRITPDQLPVILAEQAEAMSRSTTG